MFQKYLQIDIPSKKVPHFVFLFKNSIVMKHSKTFPAKIVSHSLTVNYWHKGNFIHKGLISIKKSEDSETPKDIFKTPKRRVN